MTQVRHASPPKVLEAVSVFLCPLKSHTKTVQRIEQRWQESSPEEAARLLKDEIRLFHDDFWGEEVMAFGKGHMLQAMVRPKAAWVPGHDWVVLVLEATVCPEDAAGSGLLLDGLLTLNVGFRRTQGEPEPQDSFFGLEMGALKLADGRSSSALYEAQARKIVGDNPEPLENLKKAVLLSYARFDRPLSDQELYRFGSVAYPQEPVTAEWSERRAEHIFDRWKAAGWRCFAYSYSLVYALDAHYAGRDDASIRQRFLNTDATEAYP